MLRLFEREIYPQRRIVADFLTHGVTRQRLQAQIQENGGYHIVHWSGHGHLNLLELAKPGGAQDFLSGEDLLDLFIRAGGFIPCLVFLSACHSGDILRVQDWNDFLAVAQGKEPGTKDTPVSETKDIPLDARPGYTGTAHALLQGGVPSVVAMRYAVGDDYARELAIEFYRALLAHAQPKTAAAALTMARQALLDQLSRDASPDARRLLWMIAVANEPVPLGLLQSVWGGEEDEEQQQLRQIKQMLDMLPVLPPELQEQLKAMPPELRAMIDVLPPAAQTRPDPTPLLRHLVAVGLATEERTGPDDANPDLTCHELVRERIRTWMHDHPQDQADLTENTIRLSYAERLAAVYNTLQHQNMTTAPQAGSRALVYYVQAGAYDRLGSFASSVVTSTSDSQLLAGLLPYLKAAIDAAPEGRPRWSCLCNLADALRLGGHPDASLPFYEQATTQARTAPEAGGENGRQAWADIATITGNWANALGDISNLEASRQRYLKSAEAEKKAGRHAVNIIISELEVLRIDIRQGQTAQALPQVEAWLAQVEAWWQQYRSGQPVPEAPNPELLARVLISALDIAREAHFAQGAWEPALRRIDATLEVNRVLERPAEDIAVIRVNRAIVLRHLGLFGEAKAELEACLQLFQNDPVRRQSVLGSLASLFNEQDDVPQAITQGRRALALCEQLPDPRARASSHGSLALYLDRSGAPSALAESPRHQLAALMYRLVAGLRQGLQTSLSHYAINFRRAQAAGTPLTVPRVAELLADPTFRPLDDWLRQRQADVAEVQANVDHFLNRVRQAALEQK